MPIPKSAMLAAVLVLMAIGASPVWAACPAKPLTQCDFYFEGHKNAIPTFRLKNGGDQRVDPAKLRYSVVQNKKILDFYAEIDSTGYATSYPPKFPPVKNQFYLQGFPASQLWSKTYNTQFQGFLNKCIVLPIRSALLKVNGKTINLNPGNGNPLFPEGRRCVVFKTK